ncbi:hypothetical protein BRD17_00520 [Halobacteriales archaeon SW_7_68_16]|nr:MAG: hypothetical protein BRD17_00520 [Halobacteriales archaeon SW_7_68_16]
MTEYDWDAGRSVTGDVSLTGGEATPVGVRGTEDCFVPTGSVDGDLRIVDAEYVYTHRAIGDAAVERLATSLTGAIEDTYAEEVDGDVVVADAEDVYVGVDAVAGDVGVLGAERVFGPAATGPGVPPGRLRSIVGWDREERVTDVDRGLHVAGGRCSLAIESLTGTIEAYVLGHHNEVRIEGRGDVDIHVVGAENEVSVGPYVDATLETAVGRDNDLRSDSYPVEDLISETRSEVTPFLGRSKVTWQEPAGESPCPSCGTDTTAVIERRRMDALFVFGYPLRVYESGSRHECVACTREPPTGISRGGQSPIR